MTAARRAVFVLAEALAAGGVVVLAVVWPPLHEPNRADVVVLLSGDGARLPVALRLMDRQVAATLVVVGEPDTVEVGNLCHETQAFEVACLRPRPDNTRTEARATGRLARERHWKSMVVVTSRFHASRARLLFKRCFGGTVDVVGEYPHYGWGFARRAIAHEWLGIGYATLFARGC